MIAVAAVLVLVVLTLAAFRLFADAHSAMTTQVEIAEQLAVNDRASAVAQAVEATQRRVGVSAGYPVVRLAVDARHTPSLQAALEQAATSPGVVAGAVTDARGAVLAVDGTFTDLPAEAGSVFTPGGDGGAGFVTITEPVREPGGPTLGWLHQKMSIADLVPQLQRPIPYIAGAVTLTTRAGDVIFSSAAGDPRRIQAPQLATLLAAGRAETISYRTSDEGDRVAAVAPVPGTDLMAVVGADAAAVARPATALIWKIVLTLGVTVLLVGALVAVIVVRIVRYRHHLVEEGLEARALADTDALTGLGNRRAFDRGVEAAASSGGPTAVVMVDLDYLKTINDVHGHAVGDAALRMAAAALRVSVRPGDVIARIGGDEFAMLLPETDRAGGEQVAERVRRAAGAMELGGYGGLSLTTGVDVAVHGDVSAAIGRADERLYDAKRKRRRSNSIEARLREVIDRHDLRRRVGDGSPTYLR